MDQSKVRALRHIRRFNFEYCNRYETVAEHSLFVSLLAMDAAHILNMDVGLAVIAAMLHDAPEAVTGDIPFLVKRAISNAEEIDYRAAAELGIGPAVDEYQELVGYCDAMELAMYIQEEQASGNKTLDTIYAETLARLVRHTLWPLLSGWTMDILGVDGTDYDWVEQFKKLGDFNKLKH